MAETESLKKRNKGLRKQIRLLEDKLRLSDEKLRFGLIEAQGDTKLEREKKKNALQSLKVVKKSLKTAQAEREAEREKKKNALQSLKVVKKSLKTAQAEREAEREKKKNALQSLKVVKKSLKTAQAEREAEREKKKNSLQSLKAVKKSLKTALAEREADREKKKNARQRLKAVKKSLKTVQAEQEAQRRQLEAGHDLPWREWVDQKIYNKPIVFGAFNSSKSYPEVVGATRKWENFPAEVSKHIEELECSMGRRKAGGFEILDRLDLNHDGIALAIGHILLTMCSHSEFEDLTIKMSLESKRYQSSQESEEPAAAEMKARASKTLLDRADVEVLLDSRALLNVECKIPRCFRTSDTREPADLSTYPPRYSKKGKQHVLSQRHLHCLNQVMRYMQNCDSRYAVLTSFDVSYFIRRHGKSSEGDSTEAVDISDGLRWNTSSGPSLIAALHYILTLAKDNFRCSYNADPESSSNTSKETAQGSNGDDSITIVDQAPESKDDDSITIRERVRERNGDDSITDEDQDQPPSVKRPAGDTRPASECECYAVRIGNIFQDVAEEEFHLDRDPFATGSSGSIYFGEFWGHQVAVKLATSNCSRQRALYNEAHMYTFLRDLWGKYTPKFVGHGTTSFGEVIFLATEFVHGSTLVEATITSAVATKAREALVAVHSRGILHGDLHEGNILVSEDGVRLLDFGSSRRTHPDSIECETEMGQLELMIDNLEDF